jgi:hypothetical protein
MRTAFLTASVSFAIVGTAVAGYSNAYSTSSYQDWLDAGGLPGNTDPTANLFSGYMTAEHVETFTGIDPGLYPTVGLGSATDWWKWSATSGASGGSVQVVVNQGDTVIYSMPARSALDFVFDGATDLVGGFKGGLRGIGGGFRFFNADGSATNGKLTLTLSTGDRLIRNFNSTDSFGGFWLTDASVVITSLTLEPFGSSGNGGYVGATTLYMGYAGAAPTPGAIALLGAAGLIGARRRR